MELVSEIFPDYNPLSNIIKSFQTLLDAEEHDNEVVLEVLEELMGEAGVIIESSNDMQDIIKLLVEAEVLAFEKVNKSIALVLHPQFRKE